MFYRHRRDYDRVCFIRNERRRRYRRPPNRARCPRNQLQYTAEEKNEYNNKICINTVSRRF